MNIHIRPREREAIIRSLRAGVVPSIGLHHINVGRENEGKAIIKDFSHIADDSASVRFIVGKYGSGKSFFLNLIKMIAVEQNFVVVQADVTPEKRLHATQGQARALYSELMKNLSTRAKPNGGALSSIIEKFISNVDYEIRTKDGSDKYLEQEIRLRLRPLQDLVSGYDFATVLYKYYEGHQTSNDELKESALRWLRAEFSTKTEASKAGLGVRNIIDDHRIYDYLKLMAAFSKIAGFEGLIVNLDQMDVLSHRLGSKLARNNNYEVILNILNDCNQGNVSNIGFILAGVDNFLDDPRRGMESYPALAERLRDNSFAIGGLKDYSGPIIRLENLKPEELHVLFQNIRHVFASGDEAKYLVPDEAIQAFLEHCYDRIGANAFLSPRESVKEFVGFLSVLEQNPEASWQNLLPDIEFEKSLLGIEEIIFDEEDEARTLIKEDSDLAILKL